MQKIRNKKKRVDLSNIIYFLCGFIVFSPVATYISINILKLPLALPEALFIPFYFILRKTVNFKPNYKTLAIGSFVLLFLMAIAFLVGIFPFSSILSTARGYFYMILVFSIFKNKQIPNIDILFYITFGATVAWMLLGLVSFKQRLFLGAYDEALAVYGNMIALGLFIVISVIYKRRILKLIGVLGVLILSLTVGLRRQILVAFISYFLSLFVQINFTFKRMLKLSVLLVFVSLIFVNVYPVLDNYMREASPILHRRVFSKSEELVSGNLSDSDQHRLKSFNAFIDNIEDYILPRGLVSKRSTQDEGTGIFMDSPYTEVFHTFGIILSIPLIFYLFACVWFHFKSFYIYKIKESSLWLVMSCIVISLLFVEGSFLNFVYAVPITGFVFARMASRRNLNL